jgi:hypothetical protein
MVDRADIVPAYDIQQLLLVSAVEMLVRPCACRRRRGIVRRSEAITVSLP